MDYEEWWWVGDLKRPHDPEIDYAGRLTEDDCEELYALLRGGDDGADR